MRSRAEAHVQPDSALQFEKDTQFLSSPPTSDTSARSHEDPSIFYRVAAANMSSSSLPAEIFGLGGMSSVDVPTDPVWKPDSMFTFGKLHHHSCILSIAGM